MCLHNCPIFLVENKPSSGATREMEIKQKVCYEMYLQQICSELLQLFKYIYFLTWILLFTSSSPCRKDRFPASYFSRIGVCLVKGLN